MTGSRKPHSAASRSDTQNPSMPPANQLVEHENPSEPEPQIFYCIRESSLEADFDALLHDLAIDGFWIVQDTNVLTGRSEREEGRTGSVFLYCIIRLMLKRLRIDGEPAVLTILLEPYHIDPVYRDSFYTVLSHSHMDSKRYSYRLSFFTGEITERDWFEFYSSRTGMNECLQERFIGSTVLNPEQSGSIGRTLIDPHYLVRMDSSLATCNGTQGHALRIRVSNFKITVRGHALRVRTFPYRMQDGLSMLCAETTLINLTEYYCNEFGEYPPLKCSTIHELEARFTNERTIPARGISYLVASKILAADGFYPRLYSTDSTPYGNARLHHALFTYVASGIPVAVNTSKQKEDLGHSILCIGTGPYDTRMWPQAQARAQLVRKPYYDIQKGVESLNGNLEAVRTRFVSHRTNGQKLRVVLAADLCPSYVVCDDNHVPFQARPFDNLTLHEGMVNTNILVGLHRNMVLDAWDIETTLRDVLASKRFGLLTWADDYLASYAKHHRGDFPDVVVRLFLASSRRFKQQRVAKLDVVRSLVYEEVPLPHFVWVAELYTKESFFAHFCSDTPSPLCSGNAFAELVFDATSHENERYESTILIGNYPAKMLTRMPSGATGYYAISEEYIYRPHGENGADDAMYPDEMEFGIVPYEENLTVFSMPASMSAPMGVPA